MPATRVSFQRWLLFAALVILAAVLFLALVPRFQFALYNYGHVLFGVAAITAVLVTLIATLGSPFTRAGRLARIAAFTMGVPLALCGLTDFKMLWFVISVVAPFFVAVAIVLLAIANAHSEYWKFLILSIALCLTISVGSTVTPGNPFSILSKWATEPAYHPGDLAKPPWPFK
jgi:hypothetical protein